MMKFNETLVYLILSIPSAEWDKSCGYTFALKIPIIFMMMLIGIPVAVVIDFCFAAFTMADSGARRASDLNDGLGRFKTEDI